MKVKELKKLLSLMKDDLEVVTLLDVTGATKVKVTPLNFAGLILTPEREEYLLLGNNKTGEKIPDVITVKTQEKFYQQRNKNG